MKKMGRDLRIKESEDCREVEGETMMEYLEAGLNIAIQKASDELRLWTISNGWYRWH